MRSEPSLIPSRVILLIIVLTACSQMDSPSATSPSPTITPSFTPEAPDASAPSTPVLSNVRTGTGPEGGFIFALAIDPVTPTTLYAGTIGAGVFKSTDGGATWRAVNNGLTATQVSTLAIDPATPTTLYAGTGSGVLILPVGR